MERIKPRTLSGFMELLPAQQQQMERVMDILRTTYSRYGFTPLDTPIIEASEILLAKGGGETEKQIYRFTKGDSDLSLRFDLTVPLARYYANNKEKLPTPFKAMQLGNVWRADNPQKGRFRQFTQCDIDILGDSSPNAEVELIDVTTRALLNIGFTGFTVNINDRRILRGMLESMGFAADTLDSVCITFDKMDKIGAEGVKAELTEKQLPEAVRQTILAKLK